MVMFFLHEVVLLDTNFKVKLSFDMQVFFFQTTILRAFYVSWYKTVTILGCKIKWNMIDSIDNLGHDDLQSWLIVCEGEEWYGEDVMNKKRLKECTEGQDCKKCNGRLRVWGILRGPSHQIWSKGCIYFYWRNVIFWVRLTTCQKTMSLRLWEPSQKWGCVCIIGIHRITLSKLWGRFSQLSVFSQKRL